MATRIYIDSTVKASRYLDTIPYPNDITMLPSIISGLVLQMDFDASAPASLMRNRVGNAANIIGAPVLDGYGVTLTETNYIDTGIDISQYNNSDMTMIAIVNDIENQAAIMGRVQFGAPQRQRGLISQATYWRSKWLTSSGSGQTGSLTRAVQSNASEMIVGRFVLNDGSGNMQTRISTPRNQQEAIGSAAAAAYAMQSSNILLGASVDGAGTQPVYMRAALVANRSLTDDELALVYLYYKNYYQNRGVSI